MGLKLIKDNGVVRKIWYGQYKEAGKWKVVKLTTPMHGEKIPDSLSEEGDAAFERSRARAQLEFEQFESTRMVKGSAEHLTRTLIESKTGQKIDDTRLDELPLKWRTLPRSYTPTEARMQNADRAFREFADFAKCTYLYEVTQDIATAYFNKVRSEYAWSSAQGIMSLLKSAFARFLPIGAVNPFAAAITRNREINAARINRKPLSEDELFKLIEESKNDPMLHALTVTAACTGMRIGDVCMLTWDAIDLPSGFISVLTAKAGKRVEIPILEPLRLVLETANATRSSATPFVFPTAAQMYSANPSGIIHRGKILFARALFAQTPQTTSSAIEVEQEAKSPEEIFACIRAARFTAQKTERCIKVYSLYMSGLSYRQIEAETGLSRGQIGGYLHTIEEITQTTIVKWQSDCANSNTRLIKMTRKERKVGTQKYGKCAASLYGWHSLRATFVVTALTNGIPIEVVRRIVGHSTVRMTEEYFNPTKQIMAEAVRNKMSRSILGGSLTRPALVEPKQSEDADDLAALAKKLAALSPAQREQLKALIG